MTAREGLGTGPSTDEIGPPRDGLSVSGGAAGIRVGLEDVMGAATRLSCHAAELRADNGALTRGAAPDLASGALAKALADPLIAVRLRAAIAAVGQAVVRATGPTGGVAAAAKMTLLAAQTRAAARAYIACEARARALVAKGCDGLTAGAAAAAPPHVLIGAAVLLRVGGDRAVYEHPWLVTLLGEGNSGLVTGLAGRGALSAWAVAVACRQAGVPYPPRTDTEAVGVLGAIGSFVGLFEETGRVRVDEHPIAGCTYLPTGIGGLMRGNAAMNSSEQRVRVTELPAADGGPSRWVVQISGTQDWSPKAGSNPYDLTTDVVAMAQQGTAAKKGVAEALAKAQDDSRRRTGRDTSSEEVLLSGHSQGGILAASLASDPDFRVKHHVKAVVSYGAPVNRFPIPPDTPILSVEHKQDSVPRLDGATRTDARHWTTITRDLADTNGPRSTGASHDSRRYIETADAIDRLPQGQSASLDQFRRQSKGFLQRSPGGPQPIVREYTLTRE